ncbi:hypothetical protein EDEG_02699, partial [Edhazardia aedis USNM 41457]
KRIRYKNKFKFNFYLLSFLYFDYLLFFCSQSFDIFLRFILSFYFGIRLWVLSFYSYLCSFIKIIIPFVCWIAKSTIDHIIIMITFESLWFGFVTIFHNYNYYY